MVAEAQFFSLFKKKSLELQLILLNLMLNGIYRIWFLYSNAATAAFVMSSSQCTKAPKKASYLLSSWLWLTLEALSILQQERTCPNKLDFHPLLFSPLSS